jgi:hypothetical protein
VESDYDRLGQQLIDINERVLFAKGSIEHCWLYDYLSSNYDPHEITYSAGDNPQKNSLAYHIVQAQKTEWLACASYVEPSADVLVWIDYGIFHIPGVTAAIIDDFVRRTASEQAIAIPGCWEKDQYPYDDLWPCWRFCGGCFIVPRRYVEPFNEAMKREYKRWIAETKNVSWDVNTLARLEKQELLPIWWYGPCDHNETMFTLYKSSGGAVQ